jgi:hypothetical protein
MSSNLTTFFPSAGGGGSTTSSDPKSMDRHYIDTEHLLLQYQGFNWDSTETGFWDRISSSTVTGSDPVSSTILLPADSSAYQTVVDISNVGIGGGLYNVIGPTLIGSVIPTRVLTFKITIDGTATEIVYDMIKYYARPLLGGFLTGRSGFSTSYGSYGGDTISSNNNYNSNGVASDKGATGGFVQMAYGNNTLTVPSSFSGFSHVKFEDTCKVEVKVVGEVFGTQFREYVAALYLLN